MLAVAGIKLPSAGYVHLSRKAIAQKAVDFGTDAIVGLVFLQTSSRIEIYAELNLHCKKSAERLLLQYLGLSGKDNGVYFYFEDEAIQHLFKVASGLDFAIPGEDQILKQLKQAFKLSVEQNLNSPLLNKLFHMAFETGKNVRNLTGINSGINTASSIAVELLLSFRKEYPGSKKYPVLIIGASETGALVTQELAKKGFKNIQIWNPTTAKAKALANVFGAITIPSKSLQEYYGKASMVVVAINKKSALLDFDQVVETGKRIIIDLSIPGQVKKVFQNNDCFVYNLETLAVVRQQKAEKRKEAMDDAFQLCLASYHEFKAWREQEWMGNSLQQWQSIFQQVSERQLKRFRIQHPDADFAIINAFAQEYSSRILKQLAWMFRQHENVSTEGQQWSRILAAVEPYEQLN